MPQFKYILWDIDGTVLNFLEAEKAAIRKGFATFSLGVCTDEMLADYSAINKKHWEKLERKELTKPEILVMRFREFFGKYGIDASVAEAFNTAYQLDLGDTICFNDDAYHLIRSLNDSYIQYSATNGTAVAQHKKLRLSGLYEVFEACFISDEVGYEKPSVEYFEAIFLHIRTRYGAFSKDRVLMIGDSLTSDIRGGRNAGIRTCWYNPKHLENHTEVQPDYEIDDLWKIRDLLS